MVAPTPLPKRKKTSAALLLSPPTLLASPSAGFGAFTRGAGSPATPWPSKLPTRVLRNELRREDRVNFVSDLQQGLVGGYNPSFSFLRHFACFEYVGIVGTPGQRRLKGDEIYADADAMIAGIAYDISVRNKGKFFGGFIGLDKVIHKHKPDSFRIVHQLFCGSKQEVQDLAQRLYDDKRLYMIVVMTGHEHVPDTHMDKTVQGCYLREGTELADFALGNEAGISHSVGSTYGTQLQTMMMPTPRRPVPAYVPETAPRPPAPPSPAKTKPRPPAPRKVARETENVDVVEVKFISKVSFSGNNLVLVPFKQSDYIAMHKAMSCFIPAGVTEDSAAEAVEHLRSVRERVELGCVELKASIRAVMTSELSDF